MIEICDFGFPQNTDMEALSSTVTTESVKSDVVRFIYLL
jgi:hypothetical protein